MRVVLDTNILVSAIVFGGPPRRVLELAVSGQFDFLTSPTILTELQTVLLRPKFKFPFVATQQILAELINLALVLNPKHKLHIIKNDPADNRILECAVEGRATHIVSGDSDLLDLEIYDKIPILNPADFLKLVDEK